jgi:hypothetical protein
MPAFVTATPIDADSDTYIQSAAPTTTRGTATLLVVGLISGKSVDDRRAVLKFDLSPLLAAISFELVTKAELVLEGNLVPVTMGSLYARKITADFVASQTTWNNKSTGVPWSVAGGDYQTELEAAFNPQSGETRIDISGLFFDAIKNEGSMLRLILMAVDSPGTSSWSFSSFDHPTAGERPYIDVEYLAGGRRLKRAASGG